MDKAAIVQSINPNFFASTKTRQLAKWSFYERISTPLLKTASIMLFSLMLALPPKIKATESIQHSSPPQTITFNNQVLAVNSFQKQQNKKQTRPQRKDRQVNEKQDDETILDKLDFLEDHIGTKGDRPWRFILCYPVIILVILALGGTIKDLITGEYKNWPDAP